MIKQESAISFKNVYQTYKGTNEAIMKGVDLTIPKSDFCIILGKSGMGKSTLLRCINGLVLPYAGTLSVCGILLKKDNATMRKIRRKTAMIFQEYNLVNRLTALENVICGMLPEMPFHRAMLGIFTDEEKARALSLLKEVGLEEFGNQRADKLSGGQKQRVGIARALAQNPQIILADEPIASLDPVTAGGILELLKKINQKEGITVLISLHQIDLAKAYGDRIIALLDGKIEIDRKQGQLTKGDIDRIYSSQGNHYGNLSQNTMNGTVG